MFSEEARYFVELEKQRGAPYTVATRKRKAAEEAGQKYDGQQSKASVYSTPRRLASLARDPSAHSDFGADTPLIWCTLREEGRRSRGDLEDRFEKGIAGPGKDWIGCKSGKAFLSNRPAGCVPEERNGCQWQNDPLDGELEDVPFAKEEPAPPENEAAGRPWQGDRARVLAPALPSGYRRSFS
ncbi:hypothetical protein KM043_005382 [Ampulex compressa]|nr:hypothetical protein KM043_005382 [Ampulex compressa]